MLFNSIDFAIFLPIVFLLYWFVANKNLKVQNFLLLIASYVFYAWWDWRFLSLIVFSSAVDYLVGIGLSKTEKHEKRKALLLLSIFVNLGFLGFFKYFNFFSESFAEAFTLLGHPFEASRLNIILPVGISFYTFQTMSYSIDVYRRKMEPTKDAIAFFSFVSFFPQLVAGPIERATNLLPQFFKKRNFEYSLAMDGLRQILWGLFKKMVIADNCAQFVNLAFSNPQDYTASSLAIGVVFFAFQIYGDFSGYSDIAIGTTRLFGFNLMKNFSYPYFSRDIAEFWRRWHISLSTWFRDYVYIPLGGSRGSDWLKVRNIFIIFIVSGFWHGANWTFIFWGALNALYFLPLLLLKRNRQHIEVVAKDRFLPSMTDFFKILLTFIITCFAWIFFRANSLSSAFEYISLLFSETIFYSPNFLALNKVYVLSVLIIGFLTLEWKGREANYAIESFGESWPKSLKYIFYYCLAMIIFFFGGKEQAFIYFQF
ncbi:MAG: membrane-bound O-acyltransferase family protein [Aequorivita sp.]|nr:membrane-bound O-acyltransferase family protein [Aequorivita sp.]